LIKVSKIVKPNENENIKITVPTSVPNSNLNIISTTTNTTKSTDANSLNTTTKKIFIKNSQSFNNLIMTPIQNSNSKTIYKILPKSINESKSGQLIEIPKVSSTENKNTVISKEIELSKVNNIKINQNLRLKEEIVEKEPPPPPPQSIVLEENKVKSILNDNLIAIRKRKRKQDFSELLHKCVSNNQYLNKLTNNIK
jgi:hypothetical protein